MYITKGNRVSKREDIVEAAQALLWEQGFEAMSPKKVMRLSGAGQGSLYHHFEGKEDLAAVALEKVAADMRTYMATVFDPEKDPMDRLYDYLLGPRDELMGCRLGRLSNEKTIIESKLCSFLADYFDWLDSRIIGTLNDAKAAGDLPAHLEAQQIAKCLQATIQGGFVLARGSGNPDFMVQAQEGAWAMLEALGAQN
jgi:TetR/AcrR family transcriptional repressor of nem operon